MLDRMRGFARTWPAKIFIAVLIVGLSVWGISNVFVNLGASTVGRVGDQDISARAFTRAFGAQINAYASQTGVVPTTDQARALGIPQVAIQQLAANAALNGLAVQSGMGASDTQVARRVADDPTFAGIIGGFDRSQFNAMLRQNGFTESEYLGEQANAVRREQLTRALFLGTKVPDTMRELVLRFQGDTRTIDYFTLTPFSIDPVAAPTDEELAAFLEENQAAYRSVETRTISGLVLSAETLAETIEVSDEDARARYEQNAASYQRPATRTIQILDLPAESTVAWFNRGLIIDRPFETLVEEAGLTAQLVDLGTMTEEQVPDPAIADVAFRLQAGQYAVLTGETDPLAIYVSAADDGGQQPYEAVADQVKSEVALSRARDQIAEITDQIEELRAALQPIGDIVSRFGLTATSATIDQVGGGLEAFDALPADARLQVASAIFAADPERLIPSVPLGANRTMWFDVTAVDPARDLTLEEARDRLTADWTDRKTNEALAARAEELVARIEAGETISDIAIEIGALAEVSAPIGRNGDGLSISPQVAQATFEGGIGYTGSVATPEGDYVVFTVNDIQPADLANAPAEMDASLQDSIAQTVYGQFIARLVEQYGLVINEVALNDLLTTGLTAQ